VRYARFVSDGTEIVGTENDGMLYAPDGREYNTQSVSWLAPVNPSKIIGLVLNYSDHANELGLQTSEDPVLFFKPPSSLVGNLGKIVYPSGVKYMHYEGELAVVIGKTARHVRQPDAFSFVKGYTIANEVTVRDFVTNTFRPPVKAKGFDTFCPLGPYLVTPDEITEVNKLNIKTTVNGQLKQQGNTKDLIHSIPRIIEFITDFMTLEPDDVILTGTPKGISPIVPGDQVTITIDSLGSLTNNVISDTRSPSNQN